MSFYRRNLQCITSPGIVAIISDGINALLFSITAVFAVSHHRPSYLAAKRSIC